MGRKGTEALLNTLLIPDIRKHLVKYGKLGAVEGRDVKPRLSHQGKQPDCF